MKNITVFAICILALLPANATSTPPRLLSDGSAASVDIDADRLAKAAAVVKRAVQRDELRAAVVLVARRGKIVLHEAYGWRDAESKLPMQKDSLFRMASNSKAVTAAGVLLLVQDGTLKLDDPVHKHIPEFDTDNGRLITIRQMLTHTSGMRIKSLFLSPLMKPSDDNPTAPNLLQEVGRFGSIGAEVPPGTSHSYNNAAYNTLAGIIEKYTGSYKQFLSDRIYEPLGMTDSCNHESDADRERMSTVFRRQDDGKWQVRWKPDDAPDFPFPRGSGGMVSTARDYAVFCQMMLNGGLYDGKRILKSEHVDAAVNPQTDFIPAAANYGLGWKTNADDKTFSHSGSDGTWVWVDPQREIIGMVLTQTQRSTNPRKVFRELVNRACLDFKSTPDAETETAARSKLPREGFYKDLFMSSGVKLTNRTTLHAADSLGLTYEYYSGTNKARQNDLIVGTEDDANGVLLYPDGAPRFRMIYVNGGAATSHGKSITKAGRINLRTFNSNGGAYCGSCAGSFLSGRNVDNTTPRRLGYLHIFPFNTLNTGLKKARLDHHIPSDSPLLTYRSFGDDSVIEDIYHNNGNWLKTSEGDHVASTEVLATYINPDHKTDGGAAIWAYRKNDHTGRVVNIGSHPEGIASGEPLALTEACFLYTLDGVGAPSVKSELQPGQTRHMKASSADGTPEFAAIGDGQYHHFTLKVEPGVTDVQIQVHSESRADLNIYVHPKSPAFRSNSRVKNTSQGASKQLRHNLKPGRWYVSVECATRVDAVEDLDSGFYRYTGRRHLLNGVPYSISTTARKSANPPTESSPPDHSS